MIRRERELTALPMLIGATLALGCHAGTPEHPWGSAAQGRPSEHGSVRTLNSAYQRTQSRVLVREIDHPTRAALDYAAYHANFMIADLEPENLRESSGTPRFDDAFEGTIDRTTLTADIARTPLTAAERDQPLAFAPLVEFLLAKKARGADALESLGSAVRGETWGLTATPGASSQAVAEAYLHATPAGARELWVKVEFAPWFKALGELPDQDGDGVPEVYAKASAALTPEVGAVIDGDYTGQLLGPAEVKGWANQLSSYWYPSFNTDLVAPGEHWPDDKTEADIKQELKGHVYPAPSIVLRGKPQGSPAYDVFIVKGLNGSARSTGGGVPQLKKTTPSPDTSKLRAALKQELASQGGGTWETWEQKLAAFRRAVKKRVAAMPAKIRATPGLDGYLFYRNELEAVAGGDLEKQPEAKNPLPRIVEFKERLSKLGVDFLFVPVPSKVEIYPDEFDASGTPLVGQVVNPWLRKLELSLAERGVECLDLLTPLLMARTARGERADADPLYQHQDTHWSDRGLTLAAEALAKRVVKYPWYAELAKHPQSYSTKASEFTRFGDLHSRLPAAQQKRYRPETLAAHQVLRADGSLYEDDPDSPITVLGDSFTGVYELTDAEHAGLSAHLARTISYPIDLVMSYGGGPNVRNKLMRIGDEALGQKRLVIWVMAARDLHDYADGWEPLKP